MIFYTHTQTHTHTHDGWYLGSLALVLLGFGLGKLSLELGNRVVGRTRSLCARVVCDMYAWLVRCMALHQAKSHGSFICHAKCII